MTTLETLGTNSKWMKRNKIIEINRNDCSFPNLVRNNFVLLFSTKKRMRKNGKKNLFPMKGGEKDLFRPLLFVSCLFILKQKISAKYDIN